MDCRGRVQAAVPFADPTRSGNLPDSFPWMSKWCLTAKLFWEKGACLTGLEILLTGTKCSLWTLFKTSSAFGAALPFIEEPDQIVAQGKCKPLATRFLEKPPTARDGPPSAAANFPQSRKLSEQRQTIGRMARNTCLYVFRAAPAKV